MQLTGNIALTRHNEGSDQQLPNGFRIEQYEIRAFLGAGGFGITYRAWNHRLACWVALKEFLPAELALRDFDQSTVRPRSHRRDDYGYALDRFLLEARTLAKFSHSNIVRVSDYLQANGTAYLVMDFVEGTPLSTSLREQPGGIAEAQIKAWFIPILRGLDKIHAAGFLHRDIKPGNIYLRDDGEPVLIDFGAARPAIEHASQSVTNIVTPGFAPVEQYGSDARRQGPWTDLYALGATLYRCISGQAPIDAPTRQGALMEREQDPLKPAVIAGHGRYSDELLALIDELMAVLPRERPQSAVTVLQAMARGCATSSLPATTLAEEAPTEPSSIDLKLPPADRALTVVPARRQRDHRLTLGICLMTAVLALFAWYRVPSGPHTSAITDSPAANVGNTAPSPVAGPATTRDTLLAGDSILIINSEPGGATLALDGVVLGTTPLRLSGVADGEFNMTLTHPAAEPHTQALRIAKGTTTERDIALELATGAIHISSKPPGASIEIDGRLLEMRTPATLPRVNTGSHSIRLSKPGYRDSERTVEVRNDTVTRDSHILAAVPSGRLLLDTSPVDARVILPDIRPAYRRGMSLPTGSYRVRVEAEGYQAHEATITVTQQDKRHSVVLSPANSGETPGPGFSDVLRVGGRGPAMVTLPAGSFTMGCSSGAHCEPDELPARSVAIAGGIAISKREITFAEYDRYASATGAARPDDAGWGRGSRPVVNVSWHDANGYATWLSEQTGKVYRLPSEVEWEYAARAGTATPYPTGAAIDRAHANFGAANCCEGEALGDDRWLHTAPVGSFPANAWGLYDMTGNVAEWTADCYPDSYAASYSATGATSQACEGDVRSLRGGSWMSPAAALRSPARQRNTGSVRSTDVGFRLVQEIGVTYSPRPEPAKRSSPRAERATGTQSPVQRPPQGRPPGAPPVRPPRR